MKILENAIGVQQFRVFSVRGFHFSIGRGFFFTVIFLRVFFNRGIFFLEHDVRLRSQVNRRKI